MEKITSINNEYIKYLNSLHQKKNRTKYKELLIEGKHLVDEAYKLNILKVIISTEETELEKYDVKKVLVNDAILNKISTTVTPQKVMGVVKLEQQQFCFNTDYCLLDNISDPGNMGTIIRTSLALGIRNILVSSDSVDVYNEKTIRATQGTIFKANIYIDDLENIYKLLKKQNVTIVTTDLKATKKIEELSIKNNFCIVLGNEANGISELSKKMADESVIIPLKNDVESLNVAVAYSIVLYQLKKE